MNNTLKITQNNIPEVVNTQLIETLATKARSTDTPNLQGNLQVAKAYRDSVEYLESLPAPSNLNINVTQDYYIRFADSAVRDVCKNTWGDGTGLTESAAAAVSSLENHFQRNTQIVNFDELRYFTGLKYSNYFGIGYDTFFNCTNLQHITLSDQHKYLYAPFQGCSSLQLSAEDLYNVEIIDGDRDQWTFRTWNGNYAVNAISSEILYLPKLKIVSFGGFCGQQNIREINFPNLEKLHVGATFAFCSNLTTVTSLGNSELTSGDTYYGIRHGIFQDCVNLTSINIPNWTRIPNDMFWNCYRLQQIVIPDSVQMICGGAFLGTHELRVIYGPNVTKCSSTVPFQSYNGKWIYLPKLTQFKSYDNHQKAEVDSYPSWNRYWPISLFAYNDPIVPNIDGAGWRPTAANSMCNLIYFRDITTFPAGIFLDARIKIVILNNSTVPTMIASTDSELLQYRADTNTYLMAHIDDSVLTGVYVPDSAVSAYQSSALFANISSKIKPISELSKVATKALWDELTDAQKDITLIEEYM